MESNFKARVSIIYNKADVKQKTQQVKQQIESTLKETTVSIKLNKLNIQGFINEFNTMRKKIEITRPKIKFEIDDSAIKKYKEILSNAGNKPMISPQSASRNDWDLNEGYVKNLRTVNELSQQYQNKLNDIDRVASKTFDTAELKEMRAEMQEMLNVFSKGITKDGFPTFKNEVVDVNRMNMAMSSLAEKQKQVNIEQNRIIDLKKQENFISKQTNKIQSYKDNSEGFLSSETGKQAAENMQKATAALEAYRKKATEVNKLNVNRTMDTLSISMKGANKHALSLSEMLADVGKKSMVSPQTTTKNEWGLNEGYIKNLKTVNDLSQQYQNKLNDIERTAAKTFDTTELKQMRSEMQGMINLFSQGITGDVIDFKGDALDVNRMNTAMSSLVEKQKQVNAEQKKTINLKEQENFISKQKNKIQSYKDNSEGFLSSEKGKQAAENIRKATAALEAYEKQATKVNKLDVDKTMNTLSTSMKGANKHAFSLSEMLANAGKKFISWMGVATVVMKTIQGIKLMIKNVAELDKSLIELQKVSNLSGESLSDFTDKAYKAAGQLGRLGTTLIDATAGFKRSGYTIKDSFDLGEEALMMMNIGDGIDNVEVAVATLISTLKAYNLQASDARMVNDLLNEVSNNSAISFDRLAEGIKRTGAVYAQSGTSIEQLSGLLTGADEIMQNMEKSSAGLITISQRLRGIKEVGDEATPSVTKLGKDLQEIAGVNLTDSNGQLRGTYDVLKDLSKEYDSLTINQRQYLMEQLAGKRQVNVLQSLLSNWESVEKAVKNASNATGSATQENERYLNSIGAKVEIIKSSFSEFSKDTIDSELVKFLLDIADNFINVANKIGGLNTIAAITLLGLMKFGKLPAVFKNLQLSFAITAASFRGVSSAAATFVGVLGVLSPLLLIMVGMKIFEAIDKATISLSEQKDIVEDLTSKVTSLKDEYSKLSEQSNLSKNDKQRLSVMEKEIQLNEKLLEQEKRKQYDMEFKGDVGLWEKFKSNLGNFGNTIKTSFDWTSSIDELNVAFKENDAIWQEQQGRTSDAINTRRDIVKSLSDENTKLAETINAVNSMDKENIANTKESITEYNANVEAILEQQKALQQYRETVQSAIDSGIEVEENKEIIKSIDEQLAVKNDLLDKNGEIIESTQEIANAQQTLDNVTSGLKDSTELLTSAWNEQSSSGELSFDTVMKMISKGEEYIALLDMENGHYTLNKQGALAMFELTKQGYINDIKAKKEALIVNIAAMQQTIDTFGLSAKVYDENGKMVSRAEQNIAIATQNAAAMMGETSNISTKVLKKAMKGMNDAYGKSGGGKKFAKQLKDAKQQLAIYDKSLGVLSNLTLPSYSGATEKAAGSTSKLDTETDKLKGTIDGLKETLNQQKDALKNTEDAYKALQNAITKQLEKEIGLQEDKLGLIEEQKKIYEAMQNAAKDTLQTEIDAIQKQIDALDEKKKEEDDILALQEAQLEAKKAQDAYDAAKSNKNTRVYTEGKQIALNSLYRLKARDRQDRGKTFILI